MRRIFFTLTLLLFVLAACIEEPAPEPPEEGTPETPTATPIIETPTPEPSPTKELLPPTFTPAPTLEYQPLPTVELDLGPSPSLVIGGSRSRDQTEREQGGATGEGTYVVQKGDTLAEIAVVCGVSLQALIEANNIQDPDHIETGEVLVIP